MVPEALFGSGMKIARAPVRLEVENRPKFIDKATKKVKRGCKKKIDSTDELMGQAS